MFHVADFVTIALLIGLEGLLSADNAMVLAIIVLGLPKSQQRNALRYGIGGAFVFRTAATLLAVYLILIGFVKLIGAAYLLYLSYGHFFGGATADERRAIPPAKPWLGMNAFWATVVKVELTDIVFAIDSILVGVAMSRKVWVVLAGGLLGIVMMRLVIGKLLTIIERYPALVDGAFIIIGWVAVELLLTYLFDAGYVPFEVPRWLSLGLIVVIFGSAFAYARREERLAARARAEHAATELLTGKEDRS